MAWKRKPQNPHPPIHSTIPNGRYFDEAVKIFAYWLRGARVALWYLPTYRRTTTIFEKIRFSRYITNQMFTASHLVMADSAHILMQMKESDIAVGLTIFCSSNEQRIGSTYTNVLPLVRSTSATVLIHFNLRVSKTNIIAFDVNQTWSSIYFCQQFRVFSKQSTTSKW